MGPLNRGLAQLTVDPPGVVDELKELGPGLVSGLERLLAASISFVGEIFCEGRSRPADAKAPAFESGRFVGKTGEIFFRFEHRPSVRRQVVQLLGISPENRENFGILHEIL